jgi:endonuclease III-like uncharacterized protein
VELGKNFCKSNPLCGKCPLKRKCKQQGISEKLKKGESREL